MYFVRGLILNNDVISLAGLLYKQRRSVLLDHIIDPTTMQNCKQLAWIGYVLVWQIEVVLVVCMPFIVG